VAHPWEFVHDERGFNYRMPNLNAALGVAQLKQLPNFLKSKRSLAQAYKEAFKSCGWLRWIDEPAECMSNFWLCAVELDTNYKHLLEPLLKSSNEAGLMTRPLWKPMHQLGIYSDCERDDLMVTEKLATAVLSIPSGVRLWSDHRA
jgi:perosamine synthetase